MYDGVVRLNLTLDDEHAAVLSRLAARAHLQPGTLARSLLLTALDRTEEQERSARDVVSVLDAIDGSYERMEQGRRRAAAGDVTPLDEL